MMASSPFQSRRISLKSEATESASATSTRVARVPGAKARVVSWIFSDEAASHSLWPAGAKSRATSKPMPRLAPTTIILRGDNESVIATHSDDFAKCKPLLDHAHAEFAGRGRPCQKLRLSLSTYLMRTESLLEGPEKRGTVPDVGGC